MPITSDYKKLTSLFMSLVAIHSFIVAAALVFSPSWFLEIFGYAPISEPFFKVQAGVFHIVMVIAYVFAAIDPAKNNLMIRYSIYVKFTATIFLIVYFIFVAQVPVIILSGLGDFVMGIIIFYLNKKLNLSVTDN